MLRRLSCFTSQCFPSQSLKTTQNNFRAINIFSKNGNDFNYISRTALFGFEGHSFCKRNFASDEDGFHPDFKTIKKQYENKRVKPENIEQKIKGEIESAPVVVFMKGVPAAPQCGFSSNVCLILREAGVKNFHAVNVLEDDAIRVGIKQYTNWPTIPQVFINKEFIGGSDIMRALHDSGELETKLTKAGVLLKPPK